MTEALSELNNREIAMLIWLVIITLAVVVYPATRQTLGHLIKLLIHPKLTGSLLVLFVYVGLVVFGLERFGVWHWWMLKDTVFWLFGAGIVTFVNLTKATTEEHYFKNLLLQSVRLTVILEFILNLYVFNVFVELLLLPLIALLAMLATVAASKPEYRPVKKLLDGLMAIVGFGFLIYAVVNIAADFVGFATVKHLEDFTIPVVLTTVTLPFFYFLGLYAAYESLFVRLRFLLREKDLVRYAMWQIFKACRLRLAKVRRFAKEYAVRLGNARTRTDIAACTLEFHELHSPHH